MRDGPIVIVEDNFEDCQFLTKALTIVGVTNPLKCFEDAALSLEYLKSSAETPFLIISDIKMPVMDGLEFKRRINADENLRRKHIPFIFLSSMSPSFYEAEVVKLDVQGHFKKPAEFDELIHITRSIIDSWKRVESMND